MTPKEKVEELYDSFFELYPNQDAYFIAKRCAKIAVEEILYIITFDKDYYLNDYWEEVKSEIDNI